MTYVPDPREYQQFGTGDPNASVNCTADGAAFRLDAHTEGAITTSARIVRAHTDEPIPDPRSPGLNLGQVDNAIIAITGGKVNFDTRAQSRSLSRADVRWRINDGRFCGLSVLRSELVRHGFVTGFRGGHDITVFTRDSEPDQPLMFDSLVPSITRVSWDAVFDAAEALTGGLIYAQFTRDLTPDYHAVIAPKHPATLKPYYRYRLDDQGRITGSVLLSTGGIDQRCSVPRYHASVTHGISGRYLVQITEGKRANDPDKPLWVNARFAEELNP